MNAPTTAPTSWATQYPTARASGVFPLSNEPRVTAGLTWQPEIGVSA